MGLLGLLARGGAEVRFDKGFSLPGDISELDPAATELDLRNRGLTGKWVRG